jgi:hypothetical protein
MRYSVGELDYAGCSMSDDDSKQRDRSPNFPFIDLGTALARASQFYEAEKRGSAALPVVAKHWNYSPKSSGLLQTVAALKSYGLMEDEGRGSERRVKLTELALRILLDKRPDQNEKAVALNMAAQTPIIAQKIIEKYPSDAPSEANLEHFLIFDLKFSRESAKDAAKIFLKNAELASTYESDIISGNYELNVEPVKGIALPASPTTSIPAHGAKPVTIDRVNTPYGEIVVQFLGGASWEIYDHLEEFVKLQKRFFKPGKASGQQEQSKEGKEEEGYAVVAKAGVRRTAA